MNNKQILLRKIDWKLPCKLNEKDDPIPDIIIAADCVYSEDLTYYLLNTIYNILLDVKNIKSSSLTNTEQHTEDINQNLGWPSLPHEDMMVVPSKDTFVLLVCSLRSIEVYNHLLSLLYDKKDDMNMDMNNNRFIVDDITDWAKVNSKTIFLYTNSIARERIRVLRIYLSNKINDKI